MSAAGGKADISAARCHVRFVPEADIQSIALSNNDLHDAVQKRA